jgi:hypothetical protein
MCPQVSHSFFMRLCWPFARTRSWRANRSRRCADGVVESAPGEHHKMTQPEQAVLLWPLLALAARNQQILSYSDVQGYTGIAQHGFGQSLGLIHHYCERQRFPHLNVIVVNRDTGLPGKGMTPEEIFVEQARVFVFDWPSKDKPRANDFV